MSKFRDLTGQRFGRLVVLRRIPSDRHHTQWECICDCRKTVVLDRSNFFGKQNVSCGCLRSDICRLQLTVHGLSRDEFGRHTRLFNVWRGMKKRCLLKTDRQFHRYGGRGICICSEWMKFENFYAWAMANGYRSELSIERKDNNGNYEPNNCTWANDMAQARNRRNNLVISFQGETKTLVEWGLSTGIPSSTISSRIKKHRWSVEDALTIPVRIARKELSL